LKELAYGLVEKNAKYTESEIISSSYERIMDNIVDINKDDAAMYAEIWGKDSALDK